MTKIVEAVYAEGVLKPVEHLELPERQRVRLIVQTIDGSPARDAAEDQESPIWEKFAVVAGSIPAESFDVFPADGAAEHDHYLYGSPKSSP